jgi:septal ring factor EnvC (AmiA/AmiB activator)
MFFAYLHDIENYENLNFSIFLRPPPLLQRDAGKFLLISTAALIVSFSYPLYNMTAAGAYYSLKISSLEKELASLKIEQNKIEMLRARAQKEQNELIKRNDEEAKKQSDTVAMLKELETKRKQNSSVSAKTAQISNIAANSSVALRSIDINETHIKIECSSDKAALISKFAKKLLLATGKKISADDIAKDANSTRFIGNISMEDGE